MKIIGADIISQTVGTTTTFLGYDGHGSTRTLTDAVGSVTNTFHFDGYGMDLGWDRDTDVEYNQVNPPATDLLYSGEQYDTPLQMQYLRARYYDQNVGGFNRLDDYAGNKNDPQSLHKYAYCHGDPINGIDPTGKFTLVELLVTIAIGLTILDATLGIIYLNKRAKMKRAEEYMENNHLSKFWDGQWITLNTGEFSGRGYNLMKVSRLSGQNSWEDAFTGGSLTGKRVIILGHGDSGGNGIQMFPDTNPILGFMNADNLDTTFAKLINNIRQTRPKEVIFASCVLGNGREGLDFVKAFAQKTGVRSYVYEAVMQPNPTIGNTGYMFDGYIGLRNKRAGFKPARWIEGNPDGTANYLEYEKNSDHHIFSGYRNPLFIPQVKHQ